MAACLFGGAGALVSHRAAAAIWGLDGFEPTVVEIATARRLRAKGIVLHRTMRSRLRGTSHDGIPVTDVLRTLLDLGAVVPAHRIEPALDSALRRSLITIPQLLARLDEDGGRGRRGAGVLRRLAEDRDPGSAPAESVLEVRVRRLLNEAGIPPPVPQFEVWEGGRLLGRVDFAWPEQRVALEADGYAHHSARSDWRADRARRNRLTGADWTVLHTTWEDLSDAPELLIGQIRRALRRSDGADPAIPI